MTEAVAQAQQATANKFQDELIQMQRLQDKLQGELTDAKKKLSQERWVIFKGFKSINRLA